MEKVFVVLITIFVKMGFSAPKPMVSIKNNIKHGCFISDVPYWFMERVEMMAISKLEKLTLPNFYSVYSTVQKF